jgi:hypothetical protein
MADDTSDPQSSQGWVIDGKLESDAQGTVFDQCRVEVFFEVKVDSGVATTVVRQPEEPSEARRADSGPLLVDVRAVPTLVRSRAAAVCDEHGEFSLELPNRDCLGPTLRFVVSAPSGDTLADHELTVSRLQSPVRLKIRAVKPVVLAEATDDGAEPPVVRGANRAITGFVIERNGRTLPKALQVLVYASVNGTASANGAGVPVLVARPDAAGYFSGDVPNRDYHDARAYVSGVAEPIVIALEDKRIPRRLLLVIDAAAGPEGGATNDKDPECECDSASTPPRTPSQVDIASAPGVYSTDLGTGQCVDFTTPNRAIEEFSFYTVVRTTEPSIRGLTVGGREALPPPPGQRAGADGALPPPPPLSYPAAPSGAGGAPPPPPPGQPALTAASPLVVAPPLVVRPVAPEGAGAVGATEQPVSVSMAATAAPEILYKGGLDQMNAGMQALLAADHRLSAIAWDRDSRFVGNVVKPPGRTSLDATNPVDWDATPTFHEAATISHGHLLHFKQVWYADGYSLGDLLYSLPLAPGQKKLVSVLDWERREQTARSEDTFASEELSASLSRDRDLGEVVTGTLTESVRGGSRNTTAGVGVGSGAAGNGSYQGFNFGALLGVSGGYGESNSSAWQDSARDVSSTSLQNLRDRTLQSASAVRGLRTSVVHTVGQGEAVRATTEVVANHNHCHAVTVQYFEVLRHLKVTNELVDVQECIFFPLPMSVFDRNKVLRWRQTLQTYLQRPELAGAFDATRRVQTNWTEVSYPRARYADELVQTIAGELRLTVIIPLPPLPALPAPNPEDPLDTVKKTTEALNPTTGVFGALLAVATGGLSLVAGQVTNAAIDATKAATAGARAVAESLAREASPERQYERFHREVVPGVVEGFVNTLELYALVDGNGVSGNEVRLSGADFTLVSEYQPGVPLLVSLRGTLTNGVARDQIKQLIIKSGQALPAGFRAIVNAATIRYQTDSFEHGLVVDDRLNDDLEPPGISVSIDPSTLLPVLARTTPGHGAALYTPTDSWEQRNPRVEDVRLSTELVEHLNDNLEYYHHALWWAMDPNRRFMLMDGFLAPGSNDRSVASVVENRLIGIIGNALVLPVAHGVHLDPRFVPAAGKDLPDLIQHYKPRPVAPSRVSLPTRGVFAEAVMGHCNACEKIDDSRFWRWEESPIDEPPAIEALSTATRRTTPDGGTPTPFPTPIVSIQNAPNAPEPAGVGPVLDAVTRQSFADITGLAGTQANAAAAFSKAMDTATEFGKEASTLAQQAAMIGAKDKALGAIDEAEAGGKIDAKEARDLRVAALRKMVGDGATDEQAASTSDRLKVIDDAEAKGSITKEQAAGLRTQVLRGLDPEEAARNDEQVATNETLRKIPDDGVKAVETTQPSGKTTKVTTRPTGSAKVPIDVIFRAFVPSEVWQLELPKDRVRKFVAEWILDHATDLLPDDAAELLAAFFGRLRLKGDGRDFDLAPPPGSSLIHLRTMFDLDRKSMGTSKEQQYRQSADVSQIYRTSSTIKEQGKQAWAYKLRSDPEPPLMSGVPELGPDDASMKITQVDPDHTTVAFHVRTKAYFPFLGILDSITEIFPDADTSVGNLNEYAKSAVKVISALTPNVTANVTLHLLNRSGAIEFYVSGVHDRFPSMEMYVNGTRVVAREAEDGTTYDLLMDPTKKPLRSEQVALPPARRR